MVSFIVVVIKRYIVHWWCLQLIEWLLLISIELNPLSQQKYFPVICRRFQECIYSKTYSTDLYTFMCRYSLCYFHIHAGFGPISLGKPLICVCQSMYHIGISVLYLFEHSRIILVFQVWTPNFKSLLKSTHPPLWLSFLYSSAVLRTGWNMQNKIFIGNSNSVPQMGYWPPTYLNLPVLNEPRPFWNRMTSEIVKGRQDAFAKRR